ncbi:transmembrane protein, putative, partial [Bodo saltans]
MVKFGEYFESMVALKPEWRNAYINYGTLNELLSAIKKSMKKSATSAPITPTSASMAERLMSASDFPHADSVPPMAESRTPVGIQQEDGPPSDGPMSGIHDDEDTFVLPKSEPMFAGGGRGSQNYHHNMTTFFFFGIQQEDGPPSDGPMSGIHDDEDTFVLPKSEPMFAGGRGSQNYHHHDDDHNNERTGLLSQSVPIATSVTSRYSYPHGYDPHHGGGGYVGTPQFVGSMGTIGGVGSRQVSHGIYGNSFRGIPVENAAAMDAETLSRYHSTGTPTHMASPPLGAQPTIGRMGVSPANTPQLPNQILPILANPPNAAHNISPPVIPVMSQHGVNAAKLFEETLLKEVEKAEQFAQKSFTAFADFIEENRPVWRNPKTPIPRTKDSMRYLNKEASHLIQFLETNSLAVKTATKKYLHSHPFYIRPEVSEAALLPRFDAVLEKTAQLQGVMASLWAELFNDGDINAARSRIFNAGPSATQSFRAGMFFALIVACGLYWLHVRFELQPSEDVLHDTDWMFPISRLCISLLFAGVCWSWVLFTFERRKINYLYVFEFSQTASTTWMQCLEYSLLMFFLCCLFSVLYVRASLHKDPSADCYSSAAGFPFLAPYMMPTFLVIWISSLVFPIRHVFWKTRNAFARVFFQCMHLPFGDVRFVEFFVADWGTSMVIPCGDLLYLLCFYTAEAHSAFTNSPSGVCLDVQKKYNFPVAMIPYFWRGCQTFKMYKKTGIKAHLVNHGKYQSFLIYFVISWAYALWPCDALNVLSWIMHFVAEVYAWVWDILMDWGWIKGRERAMMFKSKR